MPLMERVKAEIGARIREIRKRAGLNQTQFGELLGGEVKSTVSNYETGDRFPQLDALLKIVEIGKVSFEWLFTGKETPSPKPHAITREQALEEMAVRSLSHDKEFVNRVCEAAGIYKPNEQLTDDEKQLLKNFRQLDQHKKSTVLEVAAMGALAVRESLEKETTENSSKEQKSA